VVCFGRGNIGRIRKTGETPGKRVKCSQPQKNPAIIEDGTKKFGDQTTNERGRVYSNLKRQRRGDNHQKHVPSGPGL